MAPMCINFPYEWGARPQSHGANSGLPIRLITIMVPKQMIGDNQDSMHDPHHCLPVPLMAHNSMIPIRKPDGLCQITANARLLSVGCRE